ncbi:MAG: GGDEF domain-containing protein [Gammaproteobacteria bacterium]|nr:GGDEF domain-containing protein [Gammaproteobacteria bacterium]
MRAIEPMGVPSAATPRTFDIAERLEQSGGTLLARLLSVLQTSLDTTEIMRLFGHEITTSIPYDELQFVRADEPPLPFSETLHECRYQLNLMGRALGVVIMRRRYPFTAAELEAIENLLCALIYPVRNALLYEDALRTALKDPVTGINNRTALDHHLDQRIAEFTRYQHPLTVIMFDIDHFKEINDCYGHISGDTVLAAVATRASQCTRSSDVIFRYGGEEFLVILSDTELAGGVLLAERIRQAIEQMEVAVAAEKVKVTVSLGVAEITVNELRSELLERADAQLYAAKATGRNKVCPAY